MGSHLREDDLIVRKEDQAATLLANIKNRRRKTAEKADNREQSGQLKTLELDVPRTCEGPDGVQVQFKFVPYSEVRAIQKDYEGARDSANRDLAIAVATILHCQIDILIRYHESSTGKDATMPVNPDGSTTSFGSRALNEFLELEARKPGEQVIDLHANGDIEGAEYLVIQMAADLNSWLLKGGPSEQERFLGESLAVTKSSSLPSTLPSAEETPSESST